jgi:hypothetical protein
VNYWAVQQDAAAVALTVSSDYVGHGRGSALVVNMADRE